MSMARRRTLAIVDDYRSLTAALANRRRELGLTGEQVDQIAGLPDRYTTKIENGLRGLGAISLPCLFGALRIKMLVIADDDAPVRRPPCPQPAAVPAVAKPRPLAQVARAPVLRPKLDNTRRPRRTAPRLAPVDATA